MALLGASKNWVRRHRGRALLTFGLAMSLLLAIGRQDAPAQPAPAKEYQVKAVFLYNFAQFVEWPASAFADSQAPLIIGVLGEDPFGSYLDETIRGERVNQRELQVRRYGRVEEIDVCHILFISRSEGARLETIFGKLKGRSVLTVGDIDDFAKRGGMMRFMKEKNKTRLRINLEAAKAAGLTISSKLLRPAEIIAPGKD